MNRSPSRTATAVLLLAVLGAALFLGLRYPLHHAVTHVTGDSLELAQRAVGAAGLSATANGEELARLQQETAAIERRTAGLTTALAAGLTLLLLTITGLLAWAFRRRLNRTLQALHLDLENWNPLHEDPEPRAADRQPDSAIVALHERLRAITAEHEQLDRLLRGMHEALIVADGPGRVTRVNTAACTLTGHPAEHLVGRSIGDLFAPERAAEIDDTPDSRPRESLLLTADQRRVPVSYSCSRIGNRHTGGDSRVLVLRDISERKRAEQRIRYLARIDSLTRVANRMQFQHLLQRGIARARRGGGYLALLYVDIDRFKDINDTFGHLAGDACLESFAQRLTQALPEGALVGRLAGDEFAVALESFSTLDELMQTLEPTARAVLEAVGRPMTVHGDEVWLTASIGVARYPLDGNAVLDLIRNADAALYEAKRAGGNCVEYYSPEMNAETVNRLMLKSKLRRAFEEHELTLRYQPKYSLHSGKVVGAEALVRWNMPERGLVLPSDFVPLAEETNLILELGEWVLNRVCEDYRDWQRSLASPGRVSVNLSLRQLRHRNFLQRVAAIFRTNGVSPTCLELEITETTLMEDADRTVRMLEALHAMGLHLAIDDFGTGYSSLSALQHFPLGTLKIDRSFVRDVATSRDDATIVATVIQMGHNLGMEVVAEGVETEAQLEFLRSKGCDYAQGMLFGEPFEADDYLERLTQQMEGTDRHRALFA